MAKKLDFWFGIVLMGFAIFVWSVASGFPKYIVSGKQLPGPNFFPILLGIIVFIFGFYEVAGCFWQSLKEKTSKTTESPHRSVSLFRFLTEWGNMNVILFVTGIALYVPFIQWIGFGVGTFIFSTLLMVRLKAGWIKSIAISAIVVLLIMLVFEKLFRIPLSPGLFNLTFA